MERGDVLAKETMYYAQMIVSVVLVLTLARIK
jgi:hypothetical protein